MADFGRGPAGRVLPRTGYPRRRALAVCLTCRERKRKCDNLRPVCSSCQQIGMACVYTKQDASAFDAASLTIIDRLAVIEDLIRDIRPADNPELEPPMTTGSGQMETSHYSSLMHAQRNHSPHVPGAPDGTIDLEVSHKVATDQILHWPVLRRLLTEVETLQYVDFASHRVETYLTDHLPPSVGQEKDGADKSPGGPTLTLTRDTSEVPTLIDGFFERVHCKNPILTRGYAAEVCGRYLQDEHGIGDLETCLMLLMCALGSVSDHVNPEFHPGNVGIPTSSQPLTTTRPMVSRSNFESARRAQVYFSAAEKSLGITMSSVSTIAAQCLCLAGIYQMYIVRPLQALNMFHAAGSLLQMLASTGVSQGEDGNTLNSSLFWTCYKSEREILAELPILAPALQQPGILDSYPSPPPAASSSASSSDGNWHRHEESSWYFFLSEIALRRITNQVAGVVSRYCVEDPGPALLRNLGDDLIPITAEFERQAHTFRHNLPPAVQFIDVPHATSDSEWRQYTRGRYYRVLELMHRPFLYAVLHCYDGELKDQDDQLMDMEPRVRELAEKALYYALAYLQHSHPFHRHHGTWLQLRNMLREASLLLAAAAAAASADPAVSSEQSVQSTLLKMPTGWEQGIEKVLVSFSYWENEFPPAKRFREVVLQIIRAGNIEGFSKFIIRDASTKRGAPTTGASDDYS